MEELRSQSEPTKRNILIVATVVIMVVVVYFWLAYFNNLFASIAPPSVADNGTGQTPQTAATAPPATDSGTGFAQGMRNSMAFIGGGFVNIFHGIENIFQAPMQYNIQPHQ